MGEHFRQVIAGIQTWLRSLIRRKHPDFHEPSLESVERGVEIADSTHDGHADIGQPPDAELKENSTSDLSDATRRTETDISDSPQSEASSQNVEEVETPKRPRNIRGRRGSRQTESHGRKTSSSVRRPELRCRKQSGREQWEIVLFAPAECNITEVRQGDTSLHAVEDTYCLQEFTGNVTVGDGSQYSDVALFIDTAPLIFKLPDRWYGEGHRVYGITRGHFIVVAPKEWTRIGHIPVEASSCADANFLAHYFYIGKDISGEIGGFKEYGDLTKTKFSLSGQRIIDDSAQGDIFVGAPPMLESDQGVTWARIGEEVEDGWCGENFRPSDKSLRNVLAGRQGRFFLRVYDEHQLVDSGEFRYLEDLREILVNDKPYVKDTLITPSSNGYSPATVAFIASDGSKIYPTLQNHNSHAEIESDGIVKVASRADADEVSCILNSDTGKVEVVIKMPRIWWRCGRKDHKSSEWHDTPIVMTREEFRAHAEEGAVVQLRFPTHIRSFHVGFGDNMSMKFPTTEGLPFNAFSDHEEIDNPSHEDELLLIECQGIKFPIIKISADLSPVPLLASPPQNALLAYVKRPHGNCRYGKGFSLDEIRNADLTVADAKRLLLPIDCRRRSMHEVNIKTLKKGLDNA